jgi:hypothetical protein
MPPRSKPAKLVGQIFREAKVGLVICNLGGEPETLHDTQGPCKRHRPPNFTPAVPRVVQARLEREVARSVSDLVGREVQLDRLRLELQRRL